MLSTPCIPAGSAQRQAPPPKAAAALPRLLGIGAQKAGTSWLHENLAQHPNVWVPPFKELHFFDHKFIPDNRAWTAAHVDRGISAACDRHRGDAAYEQYLRDLRRRPILNGTWYKKVFAQCPDHAIGCDVTPEYASLPTKGIDFLRRFLGADVKIVFLVRDPLERALSQLRMNVDRLGRRPTTMAQWLALASHPDIADRGNYAAHIPRWDRAFKPQDILYLPFGLIATSPEDILRRVERLAGLPAHRYSGLERKVFASPARTVPDGVTDYLRQGAQTQSAFLKRRFGSEFVRKC